MKIKRKLNYGVCDQEYMITFYNTLVRDQEHDTIFNKKLDEGDFYVFYNFDAAMEFASNMLQEHLEYVLALVDLNVFDGDRCIDGICIAEIQVDMEEKIDSSKLN